jgi:prenyltransferase beta subunit
MTALAGMALLMDGNTTTQGRYAPQVDRATSFLVRSSNPSGVFARGEADARPMHGHGFALLFLSQVYGMTEDPARNRQIHEVLTRGIQLTAEAQSYAGGWMYTPNARADEGSVTVTQVQGLRACRNVGLAVPKSVIDQAMQYLVNSQNSDGGIRYAAGMRGPSRPAITAAAVCCWYNAGEYDNPLAKQALAFCKEQIKPHVTQGGHDFYAHLYLAQSLFVSSDPDWGEYYHKRRDYLLGLQLPDGSWDGDNVGDVYGTAVALIVLQLPYQQVPIMQR